MTDDDRAFLTALRDPASDLVALSSGPLIERARRRERRLVGGRVAVVCTLAVAACLAVPLSQRGGASGPAPGGPSPEPHATALGPAQEALALVRRSGVVVPADAVVRPYDDDHAGAGNVHGACIETPEELARALRSPESASDGRRADTSPAGGLCRGSTVFERPDASPPSAPSGPGCTRATVRPGAPGEGEATPQQALRWWLAGHGLPAGAPPNGWVLTSRAPQQVTYTSGSWRAVVLMVDATGSWAVARSTDCP